KNMADFRLNDALHEIYSLIWDDFCDWYIELIKPDEADRNIKPEKLARGLNFFEQLMKLLHPFMPFITEEIWQISRNRKTEEALITAPWPQYDATNIDETDASHFKTIQKMISAVRNIRAEFNVPPSTEIDILINANSPEVTSVLE